ncbi:CbiX/SirB N-terminal domain-containing protein [Methylomonas sp. AM2-LC]|uniref:sirohydrochlorin chelatase n=1 Tax=Methylomonas sp. AM2-LC TaxID=3153301 RepID=UPI003264C3C6
MHLLLIAHGSRQESSNDEIRSLTERLRQFETPFSGIDCAFLEIAEPSITQGLQRLIANNMTEIVVVPYFLSAGRHVLVDIPHQIEQVRLQAPHVVIRIAPYLGAAEQIDQLLMHQAMSILKNV